MIPTVEEENRDEIESGTDTSVEERGDGQQLPSEQLQAIATLTAGQRGVAREAARHWSRRSAGHHRRACRRREPRRRNSSRRGLRRRDTCSPITRRGRPWTVDGPLSETAARMRAEREARLAGLPTPLVAGQGAAAVTAPTLGPGQAQPAGAAASTGRGSRSRGNRCANESQAKRILEVLGEWEDREAVDPHRARGFWHHVSELQKLEPFEQDVARMLAAHGYFGTGAVSPPRDEF